MSTAGRKLLSSLVRTQDLQSYIKLGLTPHLFKEGEGILFSYIENHVSKFGKIPDQTTLEEQPSMADALTDAPEPPKYYMEEVEKRFLQTTLKGTVQEAAALLTNKNADEALAVITSMVMDLHRKKNRKHLTDFRDAQTIVWDAYKQQKAMSSAVGLPFGWQTLDNMSGGARGGDFISFVGRPMMGKTFMILYAAYQAWKAGRVPMIVSMEMATLIITQRLASMHSKKKLTDLMKAELSTSAFNAMMESLGDLQHHQKPFWVVDGNLAASVDDIIRYCHQLQPDAVYVDAAYLLKHINPRLSKWDRQSENAERLKMEVATDMGLPVTASYQFGKAAAKDKKKSGTDMGLEDIHGSDAIAQLSSLSLGLFQDEGDVEALKQREIQIMKGRSGEKGSFRINWDFSANMDFSEVVKEEAKDLQMEHLG